jgi:hypothetical protein
MALFQLSLDALTPKSLANPRKAISQGKKPKKNFSTLMRAH